MSEEYAHLPGIIALEKTSNRKIAEVLTPVAQYILLYHLQVGSIEGMSPRDIAPLLPYSYESVTLGVTCLEDVGLCQKIQNGQRSKVVHFELKGKELWTRLRTSCCHLWRTASFAMTYAWMRNTPYAASMPWHIIPCLIVTGKR